MISNCYVNMCRRIGDKSERQIGDGLTKELGKGGNGVNWGC